MSIVKVMEKATAVVMAASIITTGMIATINGNEAYAAKKVPLKTITLSKSNVEIKQGKSVKLTVKYKPKNTTVKKTVKWTSSKKSVAVVKNGKVTAKKPGKATITAKVGGKKATCKVTVTEIPDINEDEEKKTNDEQAGGNSESGGDQATEEQPSDPQQGGDKTDSEQNNYADPAEAYTALNEFRTEANIWVWNEDNESKTYYNTNSKTTLSTLQKDEALEQTAKIRAKEIAEKFSHTRPDGTICFTTYPSGFMTLGENIACGYSSGNKITELWKETDDLYGGQGHRRNMLNPSFTHVGIAGYTANGTTYWVQAFGGK